MSDEGFLLASKEGILDSKNEWSKRKIFEINFVLAQSEMIHTRQITTAIDFLGSLGGMTNLLFVIAALFFAPIA